MKKIIQTILDKDVLSLFRSYLLGLLGALTVFIIILTVETKPQKVGVVNIIGIANQFIQEESKKNLPSDILKKEIQHFGKNLEKELKAFSQNHQVILLPSEAVIAGEKDYTALFRKQLFIDLLKERD